MPPSNETRIHSALVLRSAIARAPSVLTPIGTYRSVFWGVGTQYYEFRAELTMKNDEGLT